MLATLKLGDGMCLILLSFNNHPRYWLVLAGNRDEFHDRPTASADFWEDDTNVLAGRDLKDGGTWLGITKTGRIAALTNFRDPSRRKENAPSRGHVVGDFLKDQEEPLKYIQRLKTTGYNYNDFSLFLGDRHQLYFISNRNGMWQSLTPGIYVLSNHLLNTPWPKVIRGREAFREVLSKKEELSSEGIFMVLNDRIQPDDTFLPDTGVGLEWERILAPVFITGPAYGTRSSVVLLIDFQDNVTFTERSYSNSDPSLFKEKTFEFKIERF